MEKKKYVYFARIPTNVCWNGTSFPLHPKDVIECHPEFIAAFIDEKWYKEVPKDDPREPKYRFPATPSFLTPDPMKGLPVRSDPTIGPNLRGKMRPVVVLGDEPEINPYDLGVEEAVLDEEPTVVGTTVIPSAAILTELNPVPADIEAPPDEDEDDGIVVDTTGEEEESTVDLDLPDPPDEKDVQVDAPEVDEGPDIPLKSHLRNEGRDDIYDRMIAVRDAGCPLNPEMLDSFKQFKVKATRGGMFKALWKYYGFDN